MQSTVVCSHALLPVMLICLHTSNDTRVVSVVISAQVGAQQETRQSNALLDEPVSLSFTFAAVS